MGTLPRLRSRTGSPLGPPGDEEDTERNICEHLLPLLLLLVRDYSLHLVERAEGYGSGLGFLFDGELPLEDLRLIERQPFVHVIASRRLVFCERCWQSLGEWKLHRNEWT
ncbi:MAG: hypothetical protein ABI609_10400 [Acidobacteriota bacterium]